MSPPDPPQPPDSITCPHCSQPFSPTSPQEDQVRRYHRGGEPAVVVVYVHCPRCGKRVILQRKRA